MATPPGSGAGRRENPPSKREIAWACALRTRMCCQRPCHLYYSLKKGAWLALRECTATVISSSDERLPKGPRFAIESLDAETRQWVSFTLTHSGVHFHA